MRRPHLLVITTDQQCAEAMSCAGNPWVATPNMDRLAARGLRFTRAYCTQPICSPSRASAATGRWPHQVDSETNKGGLFWNHAIPREQLMGHRFAQAGYRCVWAGKDMAPSDGSRDFDLLCGWGDEQVATTMEDFFADPGEKPFLAVVNFLNPHTICEYANGRAIPEPFPGEPPLLEDCPPLPPNFGIPADEPSLIRIHQAGSPRGYHGQFFDDADWRRYRWAYYRMVEEVDRQVGRVLDALDANALAEETLIWFCSDHGDGCGAHRWNQKQLLYQESIHIPVILAGPSVPAGATDEHLVSWGLDMLPTLADAGGVEPDPDWTGRSLLELARDPASDWRHQLVVETALNHEIDAKAWRRNRGRCLLTDDGWKYTSWSWGRPCESLVDLHSDPGEMVNLATCRAHWPRRDDFRRRLHEHCLATDDPFQVTGYASWSTTERLR